MDFRSTHYSLGKDTIPEMLKELEKVHLVQDSVEGLRLTNVTAREIDIVERLGFPNLLNSAEAISRMLSVADFKSRFA